MKYARRPDTQLYERTVSGGGRVTYVPHSTIVDWFGEGGGHYHVWVRPGKCSIWHNVKPDNWNVLAAMRVAADAMLQAMGKKRAPGRCRALTEEQERKGWLAFRKAVGTDADLTFDGCSMQDVVDAGMDALKESMK